MNVFSRLFHRITGRIVSIFLNQETVSDPQNFKHWEARGFHITPKHYHSPIPDTRVLQENYPQTDKAWGIDFRLKFQQNLAEKIFPRFQAEYNAFPLKGDQPHLFYLYNDGFCGIDPHVYHCMIRHFQPRTIMEVGSGHSTLLAHQALQKNDRSGQMIVVDPYPRDFIRDYLCKDKTGAVLIERKAEEVEMDRFLTLEENDVLFIDSSHVVRIGGEVCFLILEILPRLKPGVLIQIHDIYLPHNYPKERVLDGRMFWSEQYLLQAYLIDNPKAEVMFTSHHFASQKLEVVKRTFPNAIWWTGESFWIRKR